MEKRSIQSEDSIQAGELRRTQSAARIPIWISIVVIIGAILTIAGAVISKVDPTFLTGGSPMTDAARVYADYVFARDLGLGLLLLFLLGLQARRMLAGIMVLSAFIQLLDVINDLGRGSFILVPGLLVFAIVFLVGAWQLFGQPFWKLDVWRE